MFEKQKVVSVGTSKTAQLRSVSVSATQKATKWL